MLVSLNTPKLKLLFQKHTVKMLLNIPKTEPLQNKVYCIGREE